MRGCRGHQSRGWVILRGELGDTTERDTEKEVTKKGGTHRREKVGHTTVQATTGIKLMALRARPGTDMGPKPAETKRSYVEASCWSRAGCEEMHVTSGRNRTNS
ncbi:hypothetical protein Pcinc_042848 [Petrolisthes cinctipes]|uniref:Uncharacterized protein n=1 Tax=Petrolisthes cinctipes TaxID=88211 RepID=A0AAE1BIR2_PETCI|nr:hypothetical protein Pcinc_042848 [Petrolisthes cinctipes]